MNWLKTVKTIIFGLTMVFVSCFDCKDYFRNDVKRREIKGIITHKYEDMGNHAAPMIMIDSSQKITEMNLFNIFDLFTHCSVGDSIYKAKGSLDYKLFTKDTVLFFNPICDEEIIR
jgi:hypothetical protein